MGSRRGGIWYWIREIGEGLGYLVCAYRVGVFGIRGVRSRRYFFVCRYHCLDMRRAMVRFDEGERQGTGTSGAVVVAAIYCEGEVRAEGIQRWKVKE